MPTAPRARVERRLARTARHGTGRLALALALALGAAAGEAARAVPSVDATARLAVSADVAPRALASRPGPARRSVVEVAASGLFDLFGFEVSASATYDPLCEFINPLLDDFDKLDCGEAP